MSHYFSTLNVVRIDDVESEAVELLGESFMTNARLTHEVQLMGWHPKFLRCYLDTREHLMSED